MEVRVSDWVQTMGMSRLLASALKLPMDMDMKTFLEQEIYGGLPDKSKARDEALRHYFEEKHNEALDGPDAESYRLQRSAFLTLGLGHEKKLNFIEQILDSLVVEPSMSDNDEEEEEEQGGATDQGESDVTGGGSDTDQGESDVTGAGDDVEEAAEMPEEKEHAAVPMDIERPPSPEFEDGKELEYKDYEAWEANKPPPPTSPPRAPSPEPEEVAVSQLPHAVPPARVVQGYSYSLGHPSELGFGPGRPGYARRVARISK